VLRLMCTENENCKKEGVSTIMLFFISLLKSCGYIHTLHIYIAAGTWFFMLGVLDVLVPSV